MQSRNRAYLRLAGIGMTTCALMVASTASSLQANAAVKRKKVTVRVIRKVITQRVVTTKVITLPAPTVAPPPPPPAPAPTAAPAPTPAPTVAPTTTPAPTRSLVVKADTASATVNGSGQAVFGISLGRVGFSGPVTLSVAGLPAGATSGFGPNPTDSNTNLYVTVPSSVSEFDYPLTVNASGGGVTGSTTVTLSVKKQSLSIGFGAVPVFIPGTTKSFDVKVVVANNSDGGRPTLNSTSLPPGFTLNSIVASSADTYTVTVGVPSNAVLGFTSVDFVATKGDATAKAAVIFPIALTTTLPGIPVFASTAAVAGQTPGYGLAATASSVTIKAGAVGRVSVKVSTTGGYSDTLGVILNSQGIPLPTLVGYGSNTLEIDVAVPAAQALGTYPVIVSTSGKSGVAYVVVNAVVVAP